MYTLNLKRLCKKYEELTQGRGKFFNYECELKVDENVKPVVQPLRRQPYNLSKAIKKKITKMENDGLIEKVNTPQEWLSNIVVTPKSNGDVRICLDARQINKAILREKFPIPTIDSITDEMSEAKIFTKIDLREAYTQIQLSSKCRELTNFITEDGIYRFTRLIYGINNAGDIFQKYAI